MKEVSTRCLDALPVFSAGVMSKNDHTGNAGSFEIHTLESLPRQSEQAARLQCFEIIWVRKGRGAVSIDSTVYHPDDNAIYCLTPGQLRQWQWQENTKGYYISFSPDFLFLGATHARMTAWLDPYNPGSMPVIRADEEMENEIEEVLRKMRKEFSNYYLLRSEILAGLLHIFIIYLSRKLDVKTTEPAGTKDAELVRKFVSLLRKNFIAKKMVADYASELCVSPNYLNRTVKKITGYTASHHIQQQIVLEAKRQAIHSNTSMKEIAYMLGFDNLAHFSKFFKNNSGMNFTSFKKGLAYAD